MEPSWHTGIQGPNTVGDLYGICNETTVYNYTKEKRGVLKGDMNKKVTE